MNVIIPNQQRSTMNDSGRIIRNYLLLTNFCLGVTNILTLPNFDVSSTAQSVKASMFTLTIMIAAEAYHFKYYPQGLSKKFFISSLVVNTCLLILTSIANYKLNTAFPNVQLRSLAKIPRKKRKRGPRTSKATNDKGNDGDIEDNDEEEKKEGQFEKNGMTYWAQYYSQGLHNLTVKLDEDDGFAKENMNVCIANSSNSQFKISEKLKGVVVGMFVVYGQIIILAQNIRFIYILYVDI